MATAEPDRPGFLLPLLLLAGFRTLIDDLHAELARQGHPELRPLHGFVLQAVGADGTTATELGQRLGVSKQAAGKTVDRLVALGYLERSDDPRDARRKLVRATPHGLDGLRRSAAVFDQLRQRWAATLGPDRVAALEDDLRAVTPADLFRLDVPGWFGGS
ncbi:MarR family winged helix-turn-helix transcriptional regulator [Micromonospora echinofusca]|uniref:MarR family winged helix-turn-helix transcriptional regulator n=1 Tax=Micromonospora echinofusca TaxID=47858 RepID=UPI00371689DF